jgi:hypothetical protein
MISKEIVEKLSFHQLTVFLMARRSLLLCTFAVLVTLACAGCGTASPLVRTIPTSALPSVPTKPPVTPMSSTGLRPHFTLVQQTGIFTVYGVEGDGQAVQDVAEALQEQALQINRAFDYDYRDPVTVEIFPDQASLDQYGMNPDMQGYYAYSGNHRIQMVSPSKPTAQREVDYSQRVLIAVHEYVHLVNNAINPNLPLWLNEGVAVYMGPHALYTYVCQNMFPFEQTPPFRELEQSYDSVPAADLFAYAVVDFIAHEYGQEKLNLLMRNPDRLEDILGTARSEVEQRWREYMNLHYVEH